MKKVSTKIEIVEGRTRIHIGHGVGIIHVDVSLGRDDLERAVESIGIRTGLKTLVQRINGLFDDEEVSR